MRKAPRVRHTLRLSQVALCVKDENGKTVSEVQSKQWRNRRRHPRPREIDPVRIPHHLGKAVLRTEKRTEHVLPCLGWRFELSWAFETARCRGRLDENSTHETGAPARPALGCSFSVFQRRCYTLEVELRRDNDVLQTLPHTPYTVRGAPIQLAEIQGPGYLSGVVLHTLDLAVQFPNVRISRCSLGVHRSEKALASGGFLDDRPHNETAD
jgi:hypothetical protein